MRRLARRAATRATDLIMARHAVLICLAAAALIRLAWILLNPVTPMSDFSWYYQQGLRIADGHGYSVSSYYFPLWGEPPGEVPFDTLPTAFWPVGYPAFLGAVFFLFRWLASPLFLAQFANLLLSLGIIWLIYIATRQIFRSELAGRSAMLLLALYPNHIAYTSLLSVEIFFAFLVLLGTVLIIRIHGEDHRWPLWLAAGATFGLATLTKPQAVLLPGLLLLFLFWRDWRRLLRTGAVIYLALTAVLTPWTIRNYQAFGGFTFVSTNGGVNLLIGNNPSAQGAYNWSDELLVQVGAIENERERDATARRLAVEYIRSNPLDALALIPRKLLLLYQADIDGFGWTMAAAGSIQSPGFWLVARVIAQLAYLAVLALFALALVRLGRRAGPLFWIGPLSVLYFTLIYMPFFGGSRFHFPMVVWMAAYGGVMIGRLLAELREPAPAPPFEERLLPVAPRPLSVEE